jgi:hypothetical protein
MNRFAVVTATALSVAFGAQQVLAQQVAVEIAPPTRTTIKEYVVKEKIKPVEIKEQVTVGAALPAGIELHPVPTAWGTTLTKYNYIYHNDRVVLVEPGDRKVVSDHRLTPSCPERLTRSRSAPAGFVAYRR